MEMMWKERETMQSEALTQHSLGLKKTLVKLGRTVSLGPDMNTRSKNTK